MRELTREQEQLVADFTYELSMVDGPEDMFPPDDLGGVREPRRPRPPQDIEPNGIALAAVYDLAAVRKRRACLQRCSDAVMHDIDLVLA